jgi:Holliday junction resolvase RusA-like endonuclease
MTLKSLVLRNRDIDYINKYILDNLIKPDFIREDEAFQELLQYLIINGDYT